MRAGGIYVQHLTFFLKIFIVFFLENIRHTHFTWSVLQWPFVIFQVRAVVLKHTWHTRMALKLLPLMSI
jgi:hypothetical protein